MSREQQVADFLARWAFSFDEMCSAFRETLAPDGVWDQRPIPRLTGPDAAVRFLALSRRTMGLDTIQVDVLRLAGSGDIVFAERVDHLRRRTGVEIAAAAVTGVFEFRGDTIAYWREYFDAGTFAAGAARRGLGHLGSRLLRLAR